MFGFGSTEPPLRLARRRLEINRETLPCHHPGALRSPWRNRRSHSRLQTLPDAVLIDVKNDEGTVRIEKLGTELLIRLVSHDERVEIAIPVNSVRRLMEKLET